MKQANLVRRLLTKREAAELLCVSERTIDNWRRRGLRAVKVGRVVRFDPAYLEAFIEQNKER